MILLVDSDLDLLTTYADALCATGFVVFSTSDTLEASVWFKENHSSCGLVISGCQFDLCPSGFWLAEQIKNLRPTPVLLISGVAFSLHRYNLALNLFDAVFAKPIDLDLLTHTVRQFYCLPRPDR